MDRTFSAQGIPGTFHGSSPKGSALKAFNSTCSGKSACKKIVTVVDKDSLKKYSYEVKRVVSPRKVVLGGKSVEFKFATIAKSMDSVALAKRKASERAKPKKPSNSLRKCVKKCLSK